MFKCKDNIESKNKVKVISETQSKDNKFQEYTKCLDREEYQSECNK